MNAVCFSCGEAKPKPLEACPSCRTKPANRSDKLTSLALSLECLKPHHLERATKYIKKTGTVPNFHPSVEKTAAKLIEELLDFEVSANDDDDSMEFSSSFFELDAKVDEPVGEMVLVHAIGKPEGFKTNQPLPRSAIGSRVKTYHTMEWEIGKEITAADANANMDSTQVLFIWYRWLGNQWAWRCISREEFVQLRQAEG